MPITPTQVALVVAIALGFGFIWYYEGQGRWRALLEARFLYGVPWGTLLTVGIVVAFYLLAQGGARNWSSPVMLPYVTWSYFYPTGLLTAGIAHGSPAHLVSNMTAVLVLAPIAEYAWGHYASPDAGRGDSESTGRGSESESAVGQAADESGWEWGVDEPNEPTSEVDGESALESGAELSSESDAAPVADGGPDSGLLDRPWVRAVVVFPGALLAIAVFTAVFSLGPGLGFSGAVYAIAGFAVIAKPVATIVGLTGVGAVGLLFEALSRPVVTETVTAGTPGPPSWAGTGFQAHALGFLVGAVLAIALVRSRNRRPSTQRIFGATLLLGASLSLWLITASGAETYTLYRGVGVTLLVLVTILVTLAAAGSDRPIGVSLSGIVYGPTPRQVGIAWLAVVGVLLTSGLVGAVIGAEPSALVPLGFLSVLLALPALPAVLTDRWSPDRFSRRGVAVTGLLVVVVLIALPSVPTSMLVVGDDAVPGSGEVVVEDYAVTYEEDATIGRHFGVGFDDQDLGDAQASGVIVVSDDRELWTVGVPDYQLEHAGEGTVELGSLGWQETVHAERHGWNVVGNDSAYVVDLTVDGETTRSFESEPVRSETVVDGHQVSVAPGADGFSLEVFANGSAVGTGPLPDAGEETVVDGLRFVTESVDGDEHLFVEQDDTRVQIAERETYD